LLGAKGSETVSDILPRIAFGSGQHGTRRGVAILLAVESGSPRLGLCIRRQRLDVRFIYIHRREWYLSIDVEDKPDVIERPLRDVLDVSGWTFARRCGSFGNPSAAT